MMTAATVFGLTNGSTVTGTDPKTFGAQARLTDQGKPIKWLNELEFVDVSSMAIFGRSPFIVIGPMRQASLRDQYDFRCAD